MVLTEKEIRVLATALAQYIENSDDMDPADRPVDLVLAQAMLDKADAVMAAGAEVP